VSTIALRRPRVLSLPVGAALARQPALWVAALAFVLYLPPAVSVIQLDPDSAEFIDIARRLVAGEGFTLGIRAYHVGEPEVVHDALERRAPLYPLVVAAILRAGFGPHALQVFNALLASASAALLCAIGTSLFDRRTGTLAGLLAAISPPMLIFMVPPMTEALAIFLTLLAAWLLVRNLNDPRPWPFASAGAALGLGYLTRPMTAVLVGALVFGVVTATRHKRKLLRPVATLLVGLGIFVVPITLHALVTSGSLTSSRQTYLYAVYESTDVHRNASLQPVATPIEFILANREFVAEAALENARDYAAMLFLSNKWLLPLLPAWPLAVLALFRGMYPRAAWLILLLAAANFIFYSLTWAPWARRYQLLTLLCLLPFAVDGLARLGLARLKLPVWRRITTLHLAVLAVAVMWLPTFVEEYRGTFRYGDYPVRTRSYEQIRWTGAVAWVEDRDIGEILDWIKIHTRRDDILAHPLPEIYTFFTERPSARLPRRLDPETLRAFLVDYRVAYVLLNNYDGYRRRYQSDLEALEVQGVRVIPVGEYRVFDTRALWH
jgi:4-amino-4-deoxy-L-arabinose transferase-like glycosyltransferase